MDPRQCDLAARVARLDVMARHARARDLATEVDSIRSAADAAGMMPVSAVARALERALAKGETGPAVAGWIAMLGEAVGCGRDDVASGHVFLAAGAVRLGH
jgi:hypothetical protein